MRAAHCGERFVACGACRALDTLTRVARHIHSLRFEDEATQTGLALAYDKPLVSAFGQSVMNVDGQRLRDRLTRFATRLNPVRQRIEQHHRIEPAAQCEGKGSQCRCIAGADVCDVRRQRQTQSDVHMCNCRVASGRCERGSRRIVMRHRIRRHRHNGR